MRDPAGILTVLQHGDSFFPAGAIGFSWGLESLREDGAVRDPDTLARFIDAQLRYRWASCDRGALVAAHGAGGNLDLVAAIDNELDVLALAREQREGSVRAGAAMLTIHARLGTAQVAAYRSRVIDGSSPGHLPVVQGLVWRALDVPADRACVVSAHTLCVGFLGAAVRLGLIGAVDGQKILAGRHEVIGEILAQDPPPMGRWRTFVPQTDIAFMRHETQPTRLFGN